MLLKLVCFVELNIRFQPPMAYLPLSFGAPGCRLVASIFDQAVVECRYPAPTHPRTSLLNAPTCDVFPWLSLPCKPRIGCCYNIQRFLLCTWKCIQPASETFSEWCMLSFRTSFPLPSAIVSSSYPLAWIAGVRTYAWRGRMKRIDRFRDSLLRFRSLQLGRS